MKKPDQTKNGITWVSHKNLPEAQREQVKLSTQGTFDMTDNTPASFTVTPEDQRLDFLPDLVAGNIKALTSYEHGIYNMMHNTTNGAYSGGYWEFITFSNGAKAMIIDDNQKVEVMQPSNGYQGEMTLKALSLAINAMMCSLLSFSTEGATQAELANNYHNLMDMISQCPPFNSEAGEIWAFLD